jgi:membrane protein insertase Oxa1/YidC/SpoIIIJ
LVLKPRETLDIVTKYYTEKLDKKTIKHIRDYNRIKIKIKKIKKRRRRRRRIKEEMLTLQQLDPLKHLG